MDEPEVTVTTDEAGEDLTDLDLVRKALVEGTLEIEVDPNQMAQAIVERILEEPAAEVFKPEQVIHAKDLLGRPFRIRAVRWFPSVFDKGPKVYAVADAVLLDTGEVCVVTIGATRALAQLFRAVRDDLLPKDVRVVEATRPTAAGFYPYHLEEVEQRPPAEG